MYSVAAYSNVGIRKKSNQDSCCAEVVQTPWGDTALIAVCDGVGGLSSGELASASVIRWLTSWFERTYPTLLAECQDDATALFNRIELDWGAGITLLNETLGVHGRETNQRLGTTCTAMLIYQDAYLIVHVGDCRVYQVDEHRLLQITEDQTWVQREVARGSITPEQARSHPRRNVILQSVGTQSEIHPVFVRGTVRLGATYVVCCDGYRNELFDDELASTFGNLKGQSESTIYEALASLAQLVMQRDERDNITAVALCVNEGDDYGEPVLDYTNGIATAVQPEEEAAPTGYLATESQEQTKGNTNSAGSSTDGEHAQHVSSDRAAGETPSLAEMSPREAAEPAPEGTEPTVGATSGIDLDSLIEGRYRIIDKLGEGGMSVVWLARDERLEKLWAIKEVKLNSNDGLYRANIAATRQEANIMKRLDHPALPRIVDVVDDGESLLVIMDYVPGRDLLQRLKSRGEAFEEKDVVEWGIQLCDALGYLHAQQPALVCCNMRPDNVLIDEQGRAHLINLASLREYRAGESLATAPMPPERGYAAPEVFVDAQQADPRSDIYALGATMFHMATGHNPVEYAGKLKLPAVRDVEPSVSPELGRIIAKATRLDPDDRYQGAQEMLGELRALSAVLQSGITLTGPDRAGAPSSGGPAAPTGAGE